MPVPVPTDLIQYVRQLTASQIEALLHERQAEDKALRTLWRAARAREREQRRQVREEVPHAS
jgi:hypothetical protein